MTEMSTASCPPFAVRVEIRKVRGSAPREAGASMVVGWRGARGSIGGGRLELVATERARALLAAWQTDAASVEPEIQVYPLGPSLGQCCGGEVTLAYLPWEEHQEEPQPALFHLQLHGAGHVGRALVTVLSSLACRIDWIDTRADGYPVADPVPASGAARIRKVRSDDPASCVADAPAGAFCLVMTHSHALDAAICEAALRREDLAFIGLIGSKSKRARFRNRWKDCGLTPTAIERLVCPIGIAGISGKQPEVIALSAAAQLLRCAETPVRSAHWQEATPVLASCSFCPTPC